MERELIELNGNTDKLMRAFSELNEMRQVLEKAGSFFDQKTKFGEVTMESYDRSFVAVGHDRMRGAGQGRCWSMREMG